MNVHLLQYVLIGLKTAVVKDFESISLAEFVTDKKLQN